MFFKRASILAVLVVAGLLGTLGDDAVRASGGTGSWLYSSASSTSVPRVLHTATLLNSGKVLVAGGFDGTNPLTSTELYDPITNAWSAAATMNVPREGHTATLLPDGRVLIVGGGLTASNNTSAEIYDPGTNTWTLVASMAATSTSINFV